MVLHSDMYKERTYPLEQSCQTSFNSSPSGRMNISSSPHKMGTFHVKRHDVNVIHRIAYVKQITSQTYLALKSVP